ncbi:uncharacterized protein BJ171DRAFT_201637 [Polychytrium aggregatum]|uniref:uncharacterized protein n=1 Tax=Polychytrium aggregatum TaxID=110093 RepID=UPI0022FE77B6|nr:uncharacterized protein BJ171DRAFT_201637 [Polychytrium aggregatum]KAI9199714.1 hypothetical protein BJ171DRAFT_201637 [Polychytrium aggregatum]
MRTPWCGPWSGPCFPPPRSWPGPEAGAARQRRCQRHSKEPIRPGAWLLFAAAGGGCVVRWSRPPGDGESCRMSPSRVGRIWLWVMARHDGMHGAAPGAAPGAARSGSHVADAVFAAAGSTGFRACTRAAAITSAAARLALVDQASHGPSVLRSTQISGIQSIRSASLFRLLSRLDKAVYLGYADTSFCWLITIERTNWEGVGRVQGGCRKSAGGWPGPFAAM